MSRLVPSSSIQHQPQGMIQLDKYNSTTRYIDISSAYRNRILYPQNCNFVQLVNNNNSISTTTPVTANDPVAEGFPYDAGLLSGGSTNTQFALSVNASDILNFYRDSFINIGTYYGKIIAYDSSTQIATVEAPGIPGPPPVALTPYTIRYDLPVPLDNVPTYQEATTVATPVNIFQPGVLGQSVDMQNMFVLVQGTNFPDTAQWGYLDYVVGTVAPNIQYRVRNPRSNVQFGPIPAGSTYEIFMFSYDNVRPLKYQGTDETQTPMCELKLTSLLLPSLPILDGYGGYIYNYSHIYVSVRSAKGSTFSNPLISNSPASNVALFQVPITFLYYPNKSFISLIFTGMTQRLMFRASDDLLVQLLLPNGEILQYEEPNSLLFFPGYGFPIRANPFTQIQVLMEVTRIA